METCRDTYKDTGSQSPISARWILNYIHPYLKVIYHHVSWDKPEWSPWPNFCPFLSSSAIQWMHFVYLSVYILIPWSMMLFSPFRDNAPAGCISAKFSGLWSDLKTLSTLRLPPIPEQPIPHCPTKFLLHRLNLKLGKALKVAGLIRENRQEGRRTCFGNFSQTENWDVLGQRSVLDQKQRPSTSGILRRKLKEDENAQDKLYWFCLELAWVLNISTQTSKL